MANTPPTASMSEPKRMIGGLDTKIDYICGLYIDPGSGDIYAINNDTVDTMVIFSRDEMKQWEMAKGKWQNGNVRGNRWQTSGNSLRINSRRFYDS